MTWLLGEQARNEHSAVHRRIRVTIEIGGVSWAWQRLRILQTYCRHIADILQIAVDCGGKRQIVVGGVTEVSRDTFLI